MKFSNVRGMRDLLPEQAKKKEFVLQVCRNVFRKYGFEPIETPVLEEIELLMKKGTAGEDIKNEIYNFKDKSGRELGMRFDLTVPTARFVANNPQLSMPFKRYQIGSVYRYDRPQAGRYREFTQADVDVFGTRSMLAEFEIIAVVIEIMLGLGLEFFVKINNRKLLEEIAVQNGVKREEIEECFRSLDKLDKIGEAEVEKELKAKGISSEILGKLKETNIRKVVDCEGKKELEELFGLLVENGFGQFVKLDLSLARGLAYYTGTVFEVVSSGPSVAGGGRYDKLIESYGGRETPAMGISFGIDRLIDLVQQAGVKESSVFFIPVGGTEKRTLKVTERVRKAGFCCSMDLMQRSISKNLEFARKKGFDFVVIVGEEELKENSVVLKDMKSGEQKTIKIAELSSELIALNTPPLVEEP